MSPDLKARSRPAADPASPPTRAQALVVVFCLSLVLIAAVALPLWRPLVLAAVLAATLGKWHDRVARAFGGRRTISAGLMTLGVVLLLLVPLTIAALFAIEQATQLTAVLRRTLADGGVSGLLHPLPDRLEHWLQEHYGAAMEQPRQLLSRLQLTSRAGWALGAISKVFASLSHLVFALAMMLIAFFFLLREGRGLIGWVRNSGILPAHDVDTLVEELQGVSKSIIGGHMLTGAIQAAVATAGYFIAGVPSALLVGFLTFIAAFIPSLGTAIIGLPAAGLLLLLGHTGWGIFLAAWTVFVVGLIDNFLRPIFMRGGSNLHGALIFFSFMGGILLLGPMGIVVGPIALAFFLTMTRVVGHRRRAATEVPPESSR